MIDDSPLSRRQALQCLAYGGAGTLFTLSGGVLSPFQIALAGQPRCGPAAGRPLFVQLSDTHIGFNKEANPDVNATLTRAIDLVNGLPEMPSLAIHTGDITHLSRPAEFDLAQQMLSRLRVAELHTVPGEHDTSDAAVTEYFSRFGAASANKGYYSFDHSGVHFVALVNVLQFKPGGLGSLGAEQLAWAKQDLAARSSSTPIVIFAHMPLWTVYEPWGWGTSDADELMASLRRFGSVTVLNGHIHQIVQKVEGHVTFHTARSTAYPQPRAADGPGPGPLKVPETELTKMLGISTISERACALSITDTTLASPEPHAARIEVRDFTFSPVTVAVQADSSVTWTNLDPEPHTIASEDGVFRSSAIDTNESFTFRFERPGTYRYLCTIHPRMRGTVLVG